MYITKIVPNFRMGNIQANICNKMSYPKLQVLMADTVSFSGCSKPLEQRAAIISGRANIPLANQIAQNLGITTTDRNIKNFADGETYIKINDNIKGKDAYLIQPSASPVNDSMMEMFLMIDAAKRAEAKQTIAVVPYMGYERQDRKSDDGEPIGAKLHADLLKAAGADKVVFVDLHASQIEGFFQNNIGVTHIKSLPVIAKYIKEKNLENMVVVSPDAGGAKRVELMADELDCPYAIIHKNRKEHNEAEAVRLIGDVKGKNCILYDDMIDTAGTIIEAVKMLKNNGANDVYVCAAHGLFSGLAYERLENAPIKEVIVTNTLPLKEGAPSKIKQVDISALISDKIKEISGN